MKEVTAEDAEDGNLTDKIKVIENTVDTTKEGKYKVIYEVVDSQGAKVTKKIKVTVKAKGDVSKPNNPGNSGNTSNLPQTGGTNSLLVLLSGIAAVGAGTFLKRRKK